MSATWPCEHISTETNYFIEEKGSCGLLRVKPKFCYECGKSSIPEKPKTLSEKLLSANNSHSGWRGDDIRKDQAERLAQVAYEHFKEIMKAEMISSNYTEGILEKMKESL